MNCNWKRSLPYKEGFCFQTIPEYTTLPVFDPAVGASDGTVRQGPAEVDLLTGLLAVEVIWPNLLPEKDVVVDVQELVR